MIQCPIFDHIQPYFPLIFDPIQSLHKFVSFSQYAHSIATSIGKILERQSHDSLSYALFFYLTNNNNKICLSRHKQITTCYIVIKITLVCNMHHPNLATTCHRLFSSPCLTTKPFLGSFALPMEIILYGLQVGSLFDDLIAKMPLLLVSLHRISLLPTHLNNTWIVPSFLHHFSSLVFVYTHMCPFFFNSIDFTLCWKFTVSLHV